MNQPNELGQLLKALRESNGWTQRDAEDKSGVSEGTWRLYEKGVRSVRAGVSVPVNYQAKTLRTMAAALDVDVEPLLTLAAQTPPADISDTSKVPQPRTLRCRTSAIKLDEIMRDLDRTGDAWVAAGYGYDTPEYAAREAVFVRLREWNAAFG